MGLCLLSFLLVTIQAVTTGQERVRYDRHKLIQVRATSAHQVALLRRLGQDMNLGVDFWRQPNIHLPVDIRVPPESMVKVTGLLTQAGLHHKVLVDNIQSIVDTEMNSNVRAKREISSKGKHVKNIVGTYAKFYDINNWLSAMCRKYIRIASLRHIGRTYEGRYMRAIKIGTWGLSKPAIWIDAGIHAREWISTATAIYIINEMLTKYGLDKNVTRLVRQYTWYILPSANPDGYEYSHIYDRMWRKTRSYNVGSKCRGTDSNRNWDFHWGGGTASADPCSEIFKGPYPFSEIETRAMRDFMRKIGHKTRMYLTLHSYSELWLTPWGHTAKRPVDYKDIDRVARAGASALYKVNRANFQVGTPPALLYTTGGTSYDWVKALGGVKYSYTLELRPSYNGSNGFIISASNIVPSGREVWAGIMAAVDQISP